MSRCLISSVSPLARLNLLSDQKGTFEREKVLKNLGGITNLEIRHDESPVGSFSAS
jgi:hypothetical protein